MSKENEGITFPQACGTQEQDFGKPWHQDQEVCAREAVSITYRETKILDSDEH